MSELMEQTQMVEKPAEAKADLPDSSQVYLPFQSFDLGEMKAAEALRLQLRLFEKNRALPCYYQGMLTDYLSLVENQNRCTIQIARLMLTASGQHEKIGNGNDRSELMNTLISEMSCHARRIGVQVLDLKLDMKMFFRVSRLLNDVITTVFRLQKTSSALLLIRAREMPKEKSGTAAAAGIDSEIVPVPTAYRQMQPYQPLPQNQPAEKTAARPAAAQTSAANENPEQGKQAQVGAEKQSLSPLDILSIPIVSPTTSDRLLPGKGFFGNISALDGVFHKKLTGPDSS